MRKSDRYSQRAAARLELLPDPRYGDFADADLEDSQPDTEAPTSASPHFYRPQPVRNPRPSEDFDSPARTQEDPSAYPDQFLRAPRRVAVRRGALPESLSGRIVFFGATALALLALAALVYAIAHYLLNDDHFRLATPSAIQLTGDQHVPHAVLMDVFRYDVGHNVFTIPLSDRRAALESNPWVAHATVMRLLPNRLRVTIVERRPVAFTRNGNRIALVDSTGALMDLPRAGLAAWSLPVVIGVTPDLPLSTRAARMEIFNSFTAQIDSAGPALSRKLSEVDLTDPDNVKALVSESGPDGASDVLVHFGSANYLNRFQSFEQHLPEWRQLYPHLASADMRYDHQVVLDMEPGTVTPAVNSPSPEPTTASDKTQPEPTTAQPAVTPAFQTAQPAPPPAKSETAKPKHSGFTLPSWMKFNPAKPNIPPPTKSSSAKSSSAKSSPAKPSPAQPAYIAPTKSAPPTAQPPQTNTQPQSAGKSTHAQKPSAAHFELTATPPMPAPTSLAAHANIAATKSPATITRTQTKPAAPTSQQKLAQQKNKQTKSPAAKARPTAKSAKPTTKTTPHAPTKKSPAKSHSDDAPMVLPSINSTAANHKFVPATVGGLQ